MPGITEGPPWAAGPHCALRGACSPPCALNADWAMGPLVFDNLWPFNKLLYHCKMRHGAAPRRRGRTGGKRGNRGAQGPQESNFIQFFKKYENFFWAPFDRGAFLVRMGAKKNFRKNYDFVNIS